MRRGAICVSSLTDWLGSFDKRQSGSSDQRGPRINPVPEPLSRAMGGFGLGSRTEHNDRLYVLLLPNEHGLR